MHVHTCTYLRNSIRLVFRLTHHKWGETCVPLMIRRQSIFPQKMLDCGQDVPSNTWFTDDKTASSTIFELTWISFFHLPHWIPDLFVINHGEGVLITEVQKHQALSRSLSSISSRPFTSLRPFTSSRSSSISLALRSLCTLWSDILLDTCLDVWSNVCWWPECDAQGKAFNAAPEMQRPGFVLLFCVCNALGNIRQLSKICRC